MAAINGLQILIVNEYKVLYKMRAAAAKILCLGLHRAELLKIF